MPATGGPPPVFPSPRMEMRRSQGQRLAALPTGPGVYLFRDDEGELLYVGKARNLRRRVRSYFRTGRSLPFKTRSLVQRVREVEALVVRTEREALLLEASLIRTHRPRYNRRLKDGRGYPFLKIALQAPVPRILLTYHVEDDGASYFGPCPEAGAIRGALQVVRRLYTLRSGTFERHCAPRLAADQRRMTVELLALMDGRSRVVPDRIAQAMREAAEALDFERAARLREALEAILDLARYPRAHPYGATRDPEVVARATVSIAEQGRAGNLSAEPPRPERSSPAAPATRSGRGHPLPCGPPDGSDSPGFPAWRRAARGPAS